MGEGFESIEQGKWNTKNIGVHMMLKEYINILRLLIYSSIGYP